jgi:hypothetical protein
MKAWTFVIVLAILLIAFAIYDVVKPFSSGVATSTTPTVTPGIIAGVTSVQYQNSQLEFSIWYPETAASSQVNFDGFLPVTQTPVVSFVLPSSMFQGTNLGEAGVYIGATTTPAIVSACTQVLPDSGESATTTETINGSAFTVFTASDAGAGNFYESKIYRTVQNGACLEIVELLHSGNIGNYTPGTVVEFDHAKFSRILDAIVHTYESIPTGQ